MAALFHRRKGVLCGVVVALEPGSAIGAIVLSDERKALPEIIYAHREALPYGRSAAQADKARALRRVLLSLLLNLEQRGLPLLARRNTNAEIRELFVSCAAPWSHAAVQSIYFEKDAPFIVTRELVEKIMSHAGKHEEVSSGQAQTDLLVAEGQRIVEETVTEIAPNGYAVADPYGKEASEIRITRLRGMVAEPVAGAIYEVGRHLPGAEVRIHTSAAVHYCVLRELHHDMQNALIIDISREATQILLLAQGTLHESLTIAQGTEGIARSIARAAKTVEAEALGYLRSHASGALTRAQEEALERAQEAYEAALGKGFGELARRYVLPREYVLILEYGQTDAFFSAAVEAALAAHGKTGRGMALSSEESGGLVAASGSTAIESRIALAARFFHKLHACNGLNR